MTTRLKEGASLLPGLALCCCIAAAGYLIQAAEQRATGRAWVEALVLAILVGATIRTAWTPGKVWAAGIRFSSKQLLEVAVVLLGASVSAATVMAAGWRLLFCIFAIVAGAILLSFAIGRLLGLSRKLAILVACGNSICGNSAIVAVASVIGADGDEVASSIAFTAVLGVIVVLMLPLIGALLRMTPLGYGALAGLTVYAVPQVLAAAAPAGAKAVQMGTLVKLIRVVMLGPVCVALSALGLDGERSPCAERVRPSLQQLVPWFIVGFLGMVGLRSANLIPAQLQPPMAEAAGVLTVISMAALGMGVDVRTVTRAGRPVTVTVVLSLVALGVASFAAVTMLAL